MTHRKTQVCLGCGDPFITFKNYDYCQDCAINGHRYRTPSNCSECDGSGIIKFRHHQPRPCKLCSLTQNPMKDKNYNLLNKKNVKLTPEETYWAAVDHLAQEKIYQLLTQNLPWQNTPLIKETWNYEERQQKLTGLFLTRDADYGLLLSDIANQYAEQSLPSEEILAEEVALWYCHLVMKALIGSVSSYSSYDPSFFSDLTPNNEY